MAIDGVPRRWSVVVPAKDPAVGKSRLGMHDGGALAAAMLSDALRAVLRTAHVGALIVVTDSATVRRLVEALADEPDAPARIVADPGIGLNCAIARGLEATEPPTAVLLGDVPALTPDALEHALRQAERVPTGLVPDADGTGTVLLTARDERPVPRFGAGSAAAHLGAGAALLAGDPRLRRDVDTPADLDAAIALGVGAATRAALRTGP